LLVEPFLALGVRVAILIAMVWGFLCLSSCLEEMPGRHTRLEDVYNTQEYYYIFYYVSMSVWIFEFCSMTSQFVLSYTVQQWFFAPRGDRKSVVGCCSPLEGLVACLRYHMGSIAYGSVCVLICRPFRGTMFLLTKETYEGNRVAWFCGCCCDCCVNCYNSTLRYMTKNAVMDIAINSTGFCVASTNTYYICLKVEAAVFALNAATFLFQLAGLGGIASCGAVITHLMCVHWEIFSDPLSPDYVENPLFLDLTAGALCILVAWPFIAVIGHVAHTILFCLAVHKHRCPPPPPPQDSVEDYAPGCCGCGTSRNRERYYDSPAGRPGGYLRVQ
jgi:hypothetical protein